jgi:drug/metabolite transporter (DMT)-like permease
MSTLRTYTPHMLLIACALIWGAMFCAIQIALESFGPFSLIGARFALATLALGLVFRRRLMRLSRAELGGGALLGLLLFGSIGLCTLGLQWTPSSRSAFISGLYIPLVPLLELLLLRKRLSLGAASGVALAVLGLVLLGLNAQLSLHLGLGEWLTLASALLLAGHIIAVTQIQAATRADGVNLTIVQSATAALLGGLALLLAGERLIALPSLASLAAVLVLGVVAGGVCFAVMAQAQPKIGSTQATLIYSLELPFAGLLGYLVGERLEAAAIAGCCCILLGMLAGQLPSYRSSRPGASWSMPSSTRRAAKASQPSSIASKVRQAGRSAGARRAAA